MAVDTMWRTMTLLAVIMALLSLAVFFMDDVLTSQMGHSMVELEQKEEIQGIAPGSGFSSAPTQNANPAHAAKPASLAPRLWGFANLEAFPINRNGVHTFLKGEGLSSNLHLTAKVVVFSKNSRNIAPLVIAEALLVYVLNESSVLVVLPYLRYYPAGARNIERSPVAIGDNDYYLGASALLSVEGDINSSFSFFAYAAGDGVTVDKPFGGFPRNCNTSTFVAASNFIRDNQSPSNISECSNRPWHFWSLQKTGLGAMIALFTFERFQRAMMWSNSPQAPLIIMSDLASNPKTTWGYANNCSSLYSYNCMFAPYSSCMGPPLRVNASLEISRKALKASRNPSFDRARPFVENCGDVGFAAGVVSFLTPTRQDLVRDFDSKIKQMGGGPPDYNCIAMHVRLGERGANLPEGFGPKYMSRFDLDDVLRVVRPMARAIGTRTIILVSDGVDLLQAAEAYKGDDVIFRTTAQVKHADGRDCMRESRVIGCNKNLLPEEIRYSILLDLELISRSCRHFAGTMRSSFTKLAFLRGLGLGIIQHNAISLE